ncbi:TIGR00725 family protein [candidate division KSB1 bacterium]|nr:TIGR00725 family protein [candidate division KSB1 bacterium]
MKSKKNKIIGVIGQGRDCSEELLKAAEEVGYHIARRGAILICGGLGGVMEAACRGAKKGGGTTIGMLPTADKFAANEFVDIPIVTGIGEARNSIIVRTADALIAIGGKYGTLSEIAFALAFGKPIVGLQTWQGFEGLIQCDSPVEAVETIFLLIETKQ